MTQEAKIIIGIGVVTVALLIGAVFFLTGNQAPSTTNQQGQTVFQIDYSKGQKIGSDSAKIKFVEFADLQCPTCAGTYPQVEDLVNKNKDQVQYIWRFFPLTSIHQNAFAAANAAQETAVEGKFWPFVSEMFQKQKEWESLPDPSDYFANVAKDVGADPAKVKDAAQTSKYKDIVNADMEEGNKLQVNGTPTFFVNGKMVQIQNYANITPDIQKAIDSEK